MLPEAEAYHVLMKESDLVTNAFESLTEHGDATEYHLYPSNYWKAERRQASAPEEAGIATLDLRFSDDTMSDHGHSPGY